MNYLSRNLIEDLTQYLTHTDFIDKKIQELDDEKEAEMYVGKLYNRIREIKIENKKKEFQRLKDYFHVGNELTIEEIENIKVEDRLWKICYESYQEHSLPRDAGTISLLKVDRIESNQTNPLYLADKVFICKTERIDLLDGLKYFVYLPTEDLRQDLYFRITPKSDKVLEQIHSYGTQMIYFPQNFKYCQVTLHHV